MNDRSFLAWIHERLEFQYGDNALLDHMHKLRAVIASIPEKQDTPNVTLWNSLEQQREDLKIPYA